MPKRILPVASGKGGVGKTTFAVNFALALSRHATTVLIDLDTATSSVRSSIGVPIAKDLYHVHRKGASLAECVTRLDPALDPGGHFSRFGFVAGPRHYLEDLANPDRTFRDRLTTEIHALQAEYVVLDLRAGVDPNVVEFLPYTNSGILVMTPHLPQATLAASDLVKAAMFRTLKAVFAEDSEVFRAPGFAGGRDLVLELLARSEDVYDDSVANLDAVVADLGELFDQPPLLAGIASLLDDFRVYTVLNQFAGVEESYNSAIAPFTRNLAENISTRLDVTQLGWVRKEERVHRANCSGRPVFLDWRPKAEARPEPRAARVVDPIAAELASLRSVYLGVERKPKRPVMPIAGGKGAIATAPLDALLNQQLESLRAMVADRRDDNALENFQYMAFRALQLAAPPRLPSEFGMTQIARPERLVRWLMQRALATSRP